MPRNAGKGGKGGKGRISNSGAVSGSLKKTILQNKRERIRQKGKPDSDSDAGSGTERFDADDGRDVKDASPDIITSFGGKEGAKLSSLFMREDRDAVAARRMRGSDALKQVTDRTWFVSDEFVPYPHMAILGVDARPSIAGTKLPHPMRPQWHEGMTAGDLEEQEETYFEKWCRDTHEHIKELGSAAADVAPFELNLQVWRQLWRVIEQSDVLVLIVDVRNPVFHIPPSLVHDVVVTHCRRMVIVLSKCDLVSHAFVLRWQRYLGRVLPNVGVVEFMSRPVDDPPGGERGAGGISARRRWLTRRCRQSDVDSHLKDMATALMRRMEPNTIEARPNPDENNEETYGRDEEAEQAFPSPIAAVQSHQLSSAERGINELPRGACSHQNEDETTNDGICPEAGDVHSEQVGCQSVHVGRGPGGALAIGLLGHPNVGKTSVLNSLAGRKAASVSGTAGHTKHLQHIRVDETVHPHAYVLDCPGLVFPSLSSRAQAELSGLLPLAQVRETLSAVRILAETLLLPKVFALKLPDWYDEGEPWTPLAIVEAYAEKHKYFLPRTGTPDVHRAGLEILKDAKDGALLMAYEPPS